MEDGQINGNAVPIHPLEGAEKTSLRGWTSEYAALDKGRDDIDKIDDPATKHEIMRDHQDMLEGVERLTAAALNHEDSEKAAHSGIANPALQAEIAKVMQPKLVRHLIEQRRDEALFEAKRLQNMLDQAPAALLDCTQAMAQNIFG